MSSNYESMISDKKYKIDKLDRSSLINKKDIFIFICGFIISRGRFTSYLMPFAYSLYGYILYYDRKKWWLGLSLVLGILSTGEYGEMVKNIIVFGLMTGIHAKFYDRVERMWHAGVGISISVLVVGVIVNFFGDNYLFDNTLVVIESILSFSLFYIYHTSINLLTNRSRKVYSDQEIICLAIYLSIIIMGIQNLSFYGISVSSVLSVFLILLFSTKIGINVSAPLGMILGLVQNLSTNSNPLLIVVYGLCGIVSGVFKEGGKVFVVIGFILGNAMLAFYINGTTEVYIKIQEILIAALILFAVPNAVWDKLKFFNYDKADENYQVFCKQRVTETLKNKLSKYAMLLNQMGTSFRNTKGIDDIEIYNRTIDSITHEVCRGCYLSTRCWKTDVANSYNMLVELIKYLEGQNSDDLNYAYIEFKNKCIHDERILEILNSQLSFIMMEKELMQKIRDNNQMISEQLRNTGTLIDNLRENLNEQWIIKSEEEKDILVELDKNDIGIDKLFVMQEPNGRYKVTITSGKRLSEAIYQEKIPKLISSVLNTRIVLNNQIYDDRPGCTYAYMEAAKYRLSIGIVSYPGRPGEKCGDIFSDRELSNGNRLIALCDGMGTGNEAFEESDTAMNLLERFMEAEADKKVIINTINTILMLRNEKESFSTLDYVVFDQFSGMAEFNKIGAAITLIVKGDEIKLLRGQSLPVGILDEINVESIAIELNEGDMIIMMTDGIFECYEDPQEVEQWVINTVKRIKSKNPQKISEIIFSEYKNITRHPKDDITILAAKIWKN